MMLLSCSCTVKEDHTSSDTFTRMNLFNVIFLILKYIYRYPIQFVDLPLHLKDVKQLYQLYSSILTYHPLNKLSYEPIINHYNIYNYTLHEYE